jgi:methionine aminopeptidase
VSADRTLAAIESLRATGRLLVRALGAFAERAAPGRPLGEAAAAAEALIASQGHEGRFAAVLHGAPTGPAWAERRAGRETVITLHLAARARPAGSFWYELSQIVAFDRLSPDADRALRAVERAYEAAMLVMAPGAGLADVRGAVDRAVEACGFATAGRQAVDCRPAGIGPAELNGDDPDGWRFEANEVVVFHPSPLPDGDRAFRIVEMMLIRPDGAVPISPRGSIFKRLRA